MSRDTRIDPMPNARIDMPHLRAPRVPVIEPRPEPSPVMRIMRAEASLHSSESIGLALIAEAYASVDANGKILLVEIARRFGDGR
jgi:hypothetical protein